MFWLLFVVDMNFCQTLPRFDESPEDCGIRLCRVTLLHPVTLPFVIPSSSQARSAESVGRNLLLAGGGNSRFLKRSCAHKRNARQFAAEVGGVALAVLGMVQDGVDVMEDVPLGNGAVAVADAELFQRPVGDVNDA